MHNRTMTKMVTVTAKVEQYTGSTIFSTFCRSHDYIILDRNDGEKNTKTMKKFVENAKDSLLRNNLFINVSQQCNPLIYPDGLVLHKQQLSSTCMPFFAHLSHRCICFTTNMVYQNFASISGSSTHTYSHQRTVIAATPIFSVEASQNINFTRKFSALAI